MIGEFEFDNIFFSNSNEPGDKLNYPGVSYALFVVFLVLMAILVTNLLVGLAVDDIKAVQEQAVLKRLAMQVGQLSGKDGLYLGWTLKCFRNYFNTD